MNLAQVLAGVPVEGNAAEVPAEVRGIAYDSRKAGAGFVFFAFAGAKTDGRKFAAEAVERGAIAVVSELAAPDDFRGTWLRVPHGREALAVAAGNFYAHPDRRLHVAGITGTNGKTTTSYLLDAIYRAAGKTTALVGTIEYRLAGRPIPSVNTTPESLDLLELFAELERQGGTHVVMETSSHALALGRVHGIHFTTAVFTNLTRDHLDFHGSMDDYFAAKQLLFTPRAAAPPRAAVINQDDAYGQKLKFAPKTEVIRYGLHENATACARNVSNTFEGLRFQIGYQGRSYSVESPLVGEINVYNILAAWCAAVSDGIAPDAAARGVASCTAVPGRFERIREGQPFLVIVDYAHTDDALRNTIRVARSLASGRVITMFGCGGDRDRTKRPLMGMAAAEASDLVVLTSDNPRSEDPIAIMNDALVGIRKYDTPLIAEPDREKAIRRALSEAARGDVVILAGKGHETYQILGSGTVHFDDRETARAVLHELGYAEKAP